MSSETDESTVSVPDYRLTVRRNGELRAISWSSWLVRSGPTYELLAQRGRRGITIADLTIVRDEDGLASEAILEVMCGGSDDHLTSILDWAEYIGYRRVWLADDVVDLHPRATGRAESRCQCCGGHMTDGDPVFWNFVRRLGAFPQTCMLCGGDMPQWWPIGASHAAWRAGARIPNRSAIASDRENVRP